MQYFRFLIVLVIFVLSSCAFFKEASTPYYAFTNFKVPDGTPAFRKGYADGCSSASYSRRNVFYRSKYGYKYDPKMIGNPEYRFGHSRGYSWCFQQSLGQAGESSFDRLLFPNAYDSTYSAGNVNDAWGGMFNGTQGKALGDVNSEGFDPLMGVLGYGSGGAISGKALWEGGSSGQFFGQ